MKSFFLALAACAAILAAAPAQADHGRFNGNAGSQVTVRVNGFAPNLGFHSAAARGFSGRSSGHSGRINGFGTRTVVDQFGNVYEVDVFGNVRFRGNAFSRGFGFSVRGY